MFIESYVPWSSCWHGKDFDLIEGNLKALSSNPHMDMDIIEQVLLAKTGNNEPGSQNQPAETAGGNRPEN